MNNMNTRRLFACLLLGLLLLTAIGCEDEFTPLQGPEEAAAMSITMTLPHDQQYNVSMISKVVIHFTEPIDPNSIDDRIVVRDDKGAYTRVNIDTYGGSIILTHPEHWMERANYTVTVEPGIESFAGHRLEQPKQFSFTVGMRNPKQAEQLSVVKITPDADENCWDFMTFRVYFNEPVARPTLRYGQTVMLTEVGSGELVPGNLHGRSNLIIFDPDEDLTPGKTYRLTITTGLHDYSDAGMAEDFSTDFTVKSTGNRVDMAMDHCPTAVEGDTFCSAQVVDGEYPMSSYIPLEINTSLSTSVFLGASQVEMGGRLWSEFAESSVSPECIPFVVRKGQRLLGNSVEYKVGGVIPSGITTGTVYVTLLTDAIGEMCGSQYIHGEAGLPATIRMTMDTVMTFDDPTPNSLLPQPLLGVTLVGQASVQEMPEPAGYEAMVIELIGFTEMNLGWEFLPVEMALKMVPPPQVPQERWADTTPPKVTSVSPVDMIVEPEGITGLIDKRLNGDRIVLYFSEPVDPDTVWEDNFYLEGPHGVVEGEYDNYNPKMWFTPSEPMEPNSTYRIHVKAGITDLAGNEIGEDLVYTFQTVSAQTSAEQPPMLAASVPGNLPGATMAKNFFPEFYFSQIPDKDSLVYGETYGLYDLTLGGELVPGSQRSFSLFFDFIPDNELIEGHLYRWAINDGVTNLDGLALDTDLDRQPGGPPIVIDFTATGFSMYNETAFFTYPYADTDVNGFIDGEETVTDVNMMQMDSPLITEPAFMMGFFPVNVHVLEYDEDGFARMRVNVEPTSLQFGTNLTVSLGGGGKDVDLGLLDMGMMHIMVQEPSATDIIEADDGLLGVDLDIRMNFNVENSLINSLLVHDFFLTIPSVLRYTRDGRMMTIIDGIANSGMQIPILGIMEIPVHVNMVSSSVPATRAF